MYVCVHFFNLPPHNETMKEGTNGFSAIRERLKFLTIVLKMLHSKVMASGACLEFHLTPEIWIPTESMQRGHDIAICDFK